MNEFNYLEQRLIITKNSKELTKLIDSYKLFIIITIHIAY